MSVKIRPAAPGDVPGITDILRNLGWFNKLSSAPLEVAQGQVSRHLALSMSDDSHTVYVAEDGGVIEGYISVHWIPFLFLRGPEGYISEMVVADPNRGHGIGAQLLEKVKADAVRRGCSRLSLINSRGRESYQRGFYQKHGWTERKEMANFVFKFDRPA
ncbi:MAG TPA: GNAT family N-acetyltransferase [Candidatus Acidoferrales bacterium]|nr:GNAT family N-acetyltransferase [Candidatus Acidoferrales bacterium]